MCFSSLVEHNPTETFIYLISRTAVRHLTITISLFQLELLVKSSDAACSICSVYIEQAPEAIVLCSSHSLIFESSWTQYRQRP